MIIHAYALWDEGMKNIKSVHRDYPAAHSAWSIASKTEQCCTGPIDVESDYFLNQVIQEGLSRIDSAIESVLKKY